MNRLREIDRREQRMALMESALDSTGLPPQEAARQALFWMAGQAQVEGKFDKKLADALLSMQMPVTLADKQERKQPAVSVTRKKPVSLLATTRTAEEIMDDIRVMTTFLACSELLFAGEMQLISYRIQNMLKEKNLYRHELKKYANKLKEVTDRMMMLSNSTDRSITMKQCAVISPHSLYAEDFYEDGGGLLNRMTMVFHKEFELKFKRIRMDNRWIADLMKLKHPDLVSEVFTLISLAQSDIELFDTVQKTMESITRGRLRSKSCIKSTHSEAMRNAAQNLADRFVSRKDVLPSDATTLTSQHLKEFQQDITGQQQFEFFNGQFLALKMDYIEYYLARLRMDMEKGRLGIAQIRDVWFRMGKKHAVKQFFTELKAIRLPKDKDMDAMDYSKKVAVSKGEQKALNSFRRLSTEGQRILPDKEPQDEWECRVLRSVARKFKGELPDDVLGSMVRVHKTKKAILEKLTQAGFELAPTIRRVKKMKMAELKQL